MIKSGQLNSNETRDKFIEVIENTDINIKEKVNKINIEGHFVNGPFLEITGNIIDSFNVSFYDGDNVIHNSTITTNMWTKANRQYYTDWRVVVTNSSGIVVYDEKINLSGKRVYIAFDSQSLGDTIAWFPYVVKFMEKHNCELVVSTHWNKFFKKTYPKINFIEAGVVVKNLHAMYTLGCFFNEDMEPELPNTLPLQKVATNILGLSYEEIKPHVYFDKKFIIYDRFSKPIKEKYVTIATKSTAGLKLWNNKLGWAEVVSYLRCNGYRVINVSNEGCDIEGVELMTNYDINNVMNVINNSVFFIGLSSGLSWLAWALGKHVVMISNFTDENHEFNSNCTKIVNKSVCNSCWSDTEFRFDKGDWNWCPRHKDTDRQFECHTAITGDMVIDELKKLTI